jgi:hypothetical protein
MGLPGNGEGPFLFQTPITAIENGLNARLRKPDRQQFPQWATRINSGHAAKQSITGAHAKIDRLPGTNYPETTFSKR